MKLRIPWRHRRTAAATLAAFFCAVFLVPDLWVLYRGSKWVVPFDSVETPQVVVVPGASVLRNGKPSPVLRQRVQEALWVARRWPSTKIVLSGTADGGYDEPLAMSKYLKEHGIDTARMVFDREGWSTRETLMNLGTPGGRIVVVSQKWHLNRALWLARELDWEAWGVVAGRDAPIGWENLLREHAGRAANFWQMAWRKASLKVVSLAPTSP
ncbi:MAG: YdcF family protein [Fibrobacteres bacterium]|jgi:SanA protein|nr:YdcF family protein [Fibrobacterota bacterium]